MTITFYFEYEGFYENHELFLIDVYNELGKNYNPTPEEYSNVVDTYLKIYFPRIQMSDMKQIVAYLNESPTREAEYIENIYETLNTDMLLENKIMSLVEEVKYKTKYTKIFKENYVTQSMIHLLVHSEDTDNFRRINLAKIFDGIIPSKRYPFIQYTSIDGRPDYKFNEEEMEQIKKDKSQTQNIMSWFQSITFGLSFKVRINENDKTDYRTMTINLNELGKLDYKIQWKETDKASTDDIAGTYNIIRELIKEINNTTIKWKFKIPTDDEFKTAFITTNQKFELEKKFVINHNDLSKFSRNFFPYFALVIEPRKRVSKVRENELKSKYGTYLRYKRISKYENPAKIEQRIRYFMANYEYTDQLIINEISKQFNITTEKGRNI